VQGKEELDRPVEKRNLLRIIVLSKKFKIAMKDMPLNLVIICKSGKICKKCTGKIREFEMFCVYPVMFHPVMFCVYPVMFRVYLCFM
jgi:hypothetical protein